MSRRTLVISDLHLGRGGIDLPRALEPVIAEADELVLNGDVAELHLPDHRDDAARGVESLRRRAERLGIGITFLAGNHDPLIGPRRHLHLADGAIFATHGDAVHPSLAPWSPSASSLQEAYLSRLESFAPQERSRLESVLSASRDAASREWERNALSRGSGRPWRLLSRPLALLRISLFWREYPGLVADFALRHAPEAKFVLVGHSHRPGAWRIGERTILNTGAFRVPHQPHAVLLDDTSIALVRLVRSGRRYRLAAPSSERHWSLPTPERTAARAFEGSRRPSTSPIAEEAAATSARLAPVSMPLRAHT
jgi:predicted phosphodiesterase